MHYDARRSWLGIAALAVVTVSSALSPAVRAQSAERPRPMTFLDMQLMKQTGALTPSPDGKWLLYTLSTPDWKEARRQTDLYMVSTEQGVKSTRQMTFTKEKNETAPAWSRDGRLFFFLSNRDAPENASGRNQLYVMRPDGGEARRITDAKEGISNFALSRDGRWLVYRSGKTGEEQLYRLPIQEIEGATPQQITTQPAGVGTWRWSPDSARIYFVGANAADADEKLRREKNLLEPVAAQVHQERQNTDDDSRRRGRPARAESAVDRAAHGAEAAGRANRTVHVSRVNARNTRSEESAGQGGERDGLDGPLRAGPREEVQLAGRPQDAGR
jgi:Tol biopolymer transport system component